METHCNTFKSKAQKIKQFWVIAWVLLVTFSASAETIWCDSWGKHVASPDGRYEIWLEPEPPLNSKGKNGGAALYFRLRQENQSPVPLKPIWENGHWLRATWSPDSKWVLIDDSMHYRGHLVIYGIKEGTLVKVFETEAEKGDNFPDFEFYYKVEKWLPEKDEVIIKVINCGTAFPKFQKVKVRLKT